MKKAIGLVMGGTSILVVLLCVCILLNIFDEVPKIDAWIHNGAIFAFLMCCLLGMFLSFFRWWIAVISLGGLVVILVSWPVFYWSPMASRVIFVIGLVIWWSAALIASSRKCLK